MQPSPITIKFTIAGLDIVLHALNKLPREQSNELWMDIYSQFRQQSEQADQAATEQSSPGLSD